MQIKEQSGREAADTCCDSTEKKFYAYLDTIPDADKVKVCIQCGTCGGSCPVSEWMDYSPRKIFALLRAGEVEKAVKSNTAWICASCYLCTVRCPKEIKITDVMYALKRFSIKENMVNSSTDAPALMETFSDIIQSYGRNFEGEMIMKYYFRTNPVGLMAMAPLGMALLSRGRMAFAPKRIKGYNELSKIIKKVKQMEEE